jgi:hypothetical protein
MDKLRESVKAKEPFNTKMQEKVLPGLESLLEALAEQQPEDPFRWLAEVNTAPPGVHLDHDPHTKHSSVTKRDDLHVSQCAWHAQACRHTLTALHTHIWHDASYS